MENSVSGMLRDFSETIKCGLPIQGVLLSIYFSINGTGIMSKIDFSKLKLVSSNARKLEEYRRFGVEDLQVETGVDLNEVDGTPLEVIIHKAIAAGPGRIVEDSVLVVEGETFVDARWRLDSVHEWFGKRTTWVVNLGVNEDGVVSVYTGTVDGVFQPARGKGWDYDPYFLIEHEDMTLAQLESVGRKDEYSARNRAARNMIDNVPTERAVIEDVQEWTGSFQHP
ncbi:non-canonical purine NTP pyrophosphatase [Rhizobium sp. MHM7A]|uniref:non-canonical purine NTP pyrophosphatase n=1 Tax=Rhizobium sp. MHM7A TaxID=2583233 RepID=UPI0014872B03|nr:non-canonical purine NTP pyrophosphatase [Rhizobium sp. MHM7A]